MACWVAAPAITGPDSMGALARELGLGSLEVTPASVADDERWRLVGPLATALNALPVMVWISHRRRRFESGPLGLPIAVRDRRRQARRSQWRWRRTGDHDRSRNAPCKPAPPALATRLRCGQLADLDDISRRFRLTSGNIHRAAHLAKLYAALNKHGSITPADAQRATRSLHGRRSMPSPCGFRFWVIGINSP